MLPAVTRVADAFWRALAYCAFPRVIWLTLLPLVLSVVSAAVMGYFFWQPAVAAIQHGLVAWEWGQRFLGMLDQWGSSSLRAVVAPLVVVALSLPVLVVLSLLLVAGLAMPSLVELVRARRFPLLRSRHRSPWWHSAVWSIWSTLVALALLLASLPLWLIPTVGWWLPSLIWGWLTYRVMCFDALADLATPEERTLLMARHRGALLAMGVVCGCLGMAPAAVWALGALSLVLAPLLLAVSMWAYTLVFVLSSLWFLHYLLAALQTLRANEPDAMAIPAEEVS